MDQVNFRGVKVAKIKSVKFQKKEYSYWKPFHITGSVSSTSTNIEISVDTEEGLVGLAEASPSFRVSGEKVDALLAMESFVDEMIGGMDTNKYRLIFDVTDKLLASPSIKCGVQFAVLSIFCEEHGMKVNEFFGGARDFIETDKTVGIDSIQNRVMEAENIFRSGFKQIKIKVGENLFDDINAVMKIAERTKGASYIVDANMGYTPKMALEFVNQLYRAGIDVAIFEQPVFSQDFEGLKFVRFHSPFPVAADESARTKYDVYRLIKNEAVDYINIKLMKSGISDALAIIEMARSSGVKLMIGCMGESSLGISQSILFALGVGCFDYHDLDSHLIIREDSFRGKFTQDGPIIRAI